MFDRPHHQRIARVLHAFNSDVLSRAQCYFGGGTAIALSLAEYRQSRDVDFLCASKEGYRLLRNIVSPNGFGSLLNEPLKFRREVRADMYGIRTVVEVDACAPCTWNKACLTAFRRYWEVRPELCANNPGRERSTIFGLR
jgi:hypothetical protein